MKILSPTKVIFIVTVFMLNLAIYTDTVFAEARFKDVPAYHWAANSIHLIAGKNIMKGYPDSTFKPNKGVTREELAVIIGNTFDIPQKGVYNQSFSDVGPGHWSFRFTEATKDYLPYIKGASSKANKFQPSKLATREEVAISISRALGDSSWPARANLTGKFSDAGTITPGYSDGIAKIVSLGIFTGDLQGRFRPKQPITRGEICAVLKNVFAAREKIARGPGGPELSAEVQLMRDKVRVYGKTELDNSKQVIVLVNDSKVELDNTGRFETYVDVTQEFRIIIVAFNENGRTSVVKEGKLKEPTLVVKVPTSTTKEVVAVSGTTEPGSKVNVNGEVVLANTFNGNFAKAVKLMPGINVITVVAETPDGKIVECEKNVAYTVPVKDIVLNVPDTTEEPVIQISGTVPSNYRLLLNGQKVNIHPDGSFKFFTTLYEENNNLTFLAIAPWGEQTTISRQVRLITS